MKKLFLVVLFLGMLTTVCSAKDCDRREWTRGKIQNFITEINNTENVTNVTNVTINEAREDRQQFDWGEIGHLVLWEFGELGQIGFFGSCFNQSSEGKVAIEGTFYLNRATYQKRK